MGVVKEFLDKKTGITKPIYCQRCGKKVGTITQRMRFKIKYMVYGFLIAFVLNFITQVMSDFILRKFFSL